MSRSRLQLAGAGIAMFIALTAALAMTVFGNAARKTKWEASTSQDGAPEVANAAVVVTIDNFTFSPQSLTVAAGTTVTWVNRDDIPHTIEDGERHFQSQALDTDDAFSVKFAKPGKYLYFCGIHPHMTGNVVVK
jgi:plastocyanin